jgi:hypothetical protein
LFCPQMVFRGNAVPEGVVVHGCFAPGDAGGMAVSPGRKLAVIWSRTTRVQSRTFDTKQWSSCHSLGDSFEVGGGFCGESFVMADEAGRIWKSSLNDFVFRSYGKLPAVAKAVLTAADVPVAAVSCGDGMIRLLDVSGDSFKVMSAVKLAAREAFWLSPDGKILVVKAPGENGMTEYHGYRSADGVRMPDFKWSTIFPEIQLFGFCGFGEIGWEDRDGKPWSPFPGREKGGIRNNFSLNPGGKWVPTSDGKSVFVLDGQSQLLEMQR